MVDLILMVSDSKTSSAFSSSIVRAISRRGQKRDQLASESPTCREEDMPASSSKS